MVKKQVLSIAARATAFIMGGPFLLPLAQADDSSAGIQQ
jgi:hypothetical protein